MSLLERVCKQTKKGCKNIQREGKPHPSSRSVQVCLFAIFISSCSRCVALLIANLSVQVSCTFVMVFIKIFLANALRSHLKPWCELRQTSSLWRSFFQDCAWCLPLRAEQFRNEVQLQQSVPCCLAAATSPLGHGRFPQDGMVPFNLSLISDFKRWLLYWRKSLPAHCLATHLSRSIFAIFPESEHCPSLPPDSRALFLYSCSAKQSCNSLKVKVVLGCAIYLKRHSGSETSKWEGVGKKNKKTNQDVRVCFGVGFFSSDGCQC